MVDEKLKEHSIQGRGSKGALDIFKDHTVKLILYNIFIVTVCTFDYVYTATEAAIAICMIGIPVLWI